jgi:hypothetical protein
MRARARWTDFLGTVGVQPVLFDAPAQPGRRKPGTAKRREPKEVDIQGLILGALRLHPAVERVERTNTGAGQLWQNGKPGRFVRFGFRGQPDLTGISTSGKVIAIEVKRPSTRNHLRKEQQEYLDQVRLVGGLAGVATCVEDAFAIVEGRL